MFSIPDGFFFSFIGFDSRLMFFDCREAHQPREFGRCLPRMMTVYSFGVRAQFIGGVGYCFISPWSCLSSCPRSEREWADV